MRIENAVPRRGLGGTGDNASAPIPWGEDRVPFSYCRQNALSVNVALKSAPFLGMLIALF